MVGISVLKYIAVYGGGAALIIGAYQLFNFAATLFLRPYLCANQDSTLLRAAIDTLSNFDELSRKEKLFFLAIVEAPLAEFYLTNWHWFWFAVAALVNLNILGVLVYLGFCELRYIEGERAALRRWN